MTPELRQHVAAFRDDCAADALGYYGKHRPDHSWVTVDEIFEGLSADSMLRTARVWRVAHRRYQPCPDCNDRGWTVDSRDTFKTGRRNWSTLVRSTACHCTAELPVVGMSSSLTTGGGKGGLVDRLGSVSQSTTPQAQQ